MAVSDLPDRNAKTVVAASKHRVSPVPPLAVAELGMAMLDGERKYGRFNWRRDGVTASIFYDAMMRHLLAWWSGEDDAPDSGRPHLAHVMAGAAILLDAAREGVLNDDRGKGRIVTTETFK